MFNDEQRVVSGCNYLLSNMSKPSLHYNALRLKRFQISNKNSKFGAEVRRRGFVFDLYQQRQIKCKAGVLKTM